MAKDPRFDRLPCMHRGTYADDCIVNRIQQVWNLLIFLNSTVHVELFGVSTNVLEIILKWQ